MEPARAATALGALRAAGLRLAVAESCTGGLIAARLTLVPGASASFAGGAVTYTDLAKATLAGVDERVLREHGAVGEATTRALAEGIRTRLATDIGLAVTGWAGPDAPTVEDIGRVHIALAFSGGTRHWAERFSGDRAAIREAAVEAALERLCAYLG